jgi:hypothetical protein
VNSPTIGHRDDGNDGFLIIITAPNGPLLKREEALFPTSQAKREKKGTLLSID